MNLKSWILGIAEPDLIDLIFSWEKSWASWWCNFFFPPIICHERPELGPSSVQSSVSSLSNNKLRNKPYKICYSLERSRLFCSFFQPSAKQAALMTGSGRVCLTWKLPTTPGPFQESKSTPKSSRLKFSDICFLGRPDSTLRTPSNYWRFPPTTAIPT